MRVLKNAAWLTVGRIAADLASFALFAAVSRAFGPSGTGEYSYAFAIGNLVGIIAASGFDEYGIREYACSADAERVRLWRSLRAAPSLRVIAALAVLGLFLLSGFGDIAYPVLLVEFSVYFIAWYVSRALFVPAMALQSMGAPALIDLACRGSAIAVGMALVLAGQPLPLVVAGFPLCGVALVYLAFRNAHRHLPHAAGADRHAPRAAAEPGVRATLRGATPFAAAELTYQFYSRADVLLILYWLGAAQTGLYTTAIKFVEVGIIPLVLLGAAAYPIMGRLALARSPQLEPSARDFIHLIFAMTGWLAIGIACLIPLVIVPLFGREFAPATSLLVWFGVLALGKGADCGLSRLMFSVRRQSWYLRALAFGTVLIVALNFLLIPPFGTEGAAAAAVAGAFIGNALCVYGLRQHVRPRIFAAAAARLALAIALSIGAEAAAWSVGAGPWARALAAVLSFPLAAYAVGLVPRRHGPLLSGAAENTAAADITENAHVQTTASGH